MNNTIRTTFRALQYRNFRLFFVGQSISLVGTWMQSIAMSWLVYRMTGSPFLLGVVGFAAQIPTFILSPFFGVAADRYNRHRILILTQTLSMLQALTLAALTLTGAISVWQIIILGIFLGCINSLDVPTRQSFLIEMVERKEVLGNAIALNSAMFNAARLVGPTVAGILVAVVGEGLCFLINGVSFIAVIAGLLLMKLNTKKAPEEELNIFKELKEGVHYAFGHPSIRSILLLLSLISVMGMSYVVLMPIFAKEIHRGGAHTLGFLMATIGVGALIATLYLASRKDSLKLERIIAVSSVIFALGLIFFALSRVLWFSLLMLVVTGFGFMVTTASCNTVLQTVVDDDKRGRVMSLYTVSFLGMAPLGSLLAGALANKIGAPDTVILGGLICLLSTLIFAKKH